MNHALDPGHRRADRRGADRRVHRIVRATGAGLVVAALAAVPLADPAPQAPAADARVVAYADPAGPNPFAGARVYADPDSPAARAAAAEPDPERARQLRRLASGGAAEWFGGWVPTAALRSAVSTRVGRATAAGALPVLVAYNIPQRDCGGYSAGGAGSAAAYRAWIDELAAGIGSRRAVVILEPDSLALMDCLSPADQTLRYELLTYAVRRLNSYPAIATYLDGGHSAWHPPATMAARLKRAHVVGARGFALNVSNYQTTAAQVSYGRAISGAIGWKRFVVDTSRNGLGPATGGAWCNPAGRALGARPLTPVADGLVDALLWIKQPGESDGDCGRGEPAAGVFWADYAIGLATRAAW